MNQSFEYVMRKIEALNKMDLCHTPLSTVRYMLFNSLGMPFNNFKQISNAKIFRGQISTSNPFDTKSRLSYNPNPATDVGRANLPGETVFYASSTLDTAAIESCQDALRIGDRHFYVTVGEWTLQSELKINMMCHSSLALSAGTDLPIAEKALDELMRKGRTVEQYKSLLLKSHFFSDQFAKSQINCRNDYAYSALYASEVLNRDRDICDGICYPSVAYRLKGFNIAYKTSLFDDSTFIFTGAYFVELNFIDLEIYPNFELKKETKEFSNGNILW